VTTPYQQLIEAEVTYLKCSGWESKETPVPGIFFWYKPSEERTNGQGVPRETAVIWQKERDHIDEVVASISSDKNFALGPFP
jgi:hypothetical protein